MLNIRVLKRRKGTESGASFRRKVHWKNMDTPIFTATAITTNLGGNNGVDGAQTDTLLRNVLGLQWNVQKTNK